MYSSGTLAVRCTHCRSVLAAPRGHSTIACGHCGAELHIGATSGTVRTSAELRAEMARAAEEARSAAQASNAAAESSLASCEVFEADASFAAQRLECPITTEAMKEGDRVMKLPCGVSPRASPACWRGMFRQTTRRSDAGTARPRSWPLLRQPRHATCACGLPTPPSPRARSTCFWRRASACGWARATPARFAAPSSLRAQAQRG